MEIKVIEHNEVREAAVPVARKLPDISGLVEKAAAGDLEAFGEIYTVCLNPIYRYVLYHVRDMMTAEDVTEDVFVKAWKVIASCKGRGQTFVPWLYRIAHNHTINVLKKMQKGVSLETETLVEADGPEKQVAARLSRETLLDATGRLPPDQKQVIMLKFIEGLDNREISEIMNKKEGSVRVLQMRALSRLRQQLGRTESEYAGWL
jgi:RNA polymerase sigma-70 factor (ECF subfamily)